MSREAPARSLGVSADEVLFLFTLCDGMDATPDSPGALGTLAIGSVPLTAFGTAANAPRLLLAKLAGPTGDPCREQARAFLHCALDSFGPELGVATLDDGPPADGATPTQFLWVLEDSAGGFDFFWVNPSDGELCFAPVFSMRPGVPARSIEALRLLLPVDAQRALSSIAEFTRSD